MYRNLLKAQRLDASVPKGEWDPDPAMEIYYGLRAAALVPTAPIFRELFTACSPLHVHAQACTTYMRLIDGGLIVVLVSWCSVIYSANGLPLHGLATQATGALCCLCMESGLIILHPTSALLPTLSYSRLLHLCPS